MLRFAWLFLMSSAAPLGFVEQRAGAQYYIPLFGWSLYGAAALYPGFGMAYAGASSSSRRIGAADALSGLVRRCAAGSLRGLHKIGGSSRNAAVLDEVRIRAQLHVILPTLSVGGHLLFRNEPDEYIWDNLSSLVRLSYGDQEIGVDRWQKMRPAPGPSDIFTSYHVFDYTDGRLIEATPPLDPRLKPVLAAMFHSDFSGITPARRAVAGELVAGYDTYRVDFRMPPDIRPGMAPVMLEVRGIAARPMELPVGGPH